MIAAHGSGSKKNACSLERTLAAPIAAGRVVTLKASEILKTGVPLRRQESAPQWAPAAYGLSAVHDP
ncbi:MAG TPA: hypothetical protein VEK14_02960 [Rhodomicrobium sp.]|nr:hypothetical protein [Rhodomicrobium sp.]